MSQPEHASGKALPSFHDFMDEGLGSRIAEAVAELGGSKAAGDIVGVSDEAIGRWRKGQSKPPFAGVVALCHAAKFRVEWMASGAGPRDIQPEGALSLSGTDGEHMGRALHQGAILDEAAEDAIALPRLTIEGSAGQGLIPLGEEIEDYLSVSRRYLREVGIDPYHAHVLRLSGHSMFPTLHDRDLIIVDTSKRKLQDEEVYSVVFGDTVLIKRLMPLWDGSIRIMSDNKNGNYPDAIVPASERRQLHIVGRVGGFLRLF